MTRQRPTTWSFALWWVGLVLLHIANLIYYVGFAFFYLNVGYENLAFQLMTYSIGIPLSEYCGIAVTHAVVAAIHAFYLLLMIVSSISAKRLVFYPKTSLQTLLTTSIRLLQRCVCRRRVGTEAQDQPSTSEALIRTASRTVSSIFGREGFLGVESVYFDDLLVIRELVETTLQTYQAYRMTQLLPRLGLIRVYVALLVANSWVVPGLHRVYKNQHYKRRLVSLLCDALLDTLSSMGVTLLIFATYAPQYSDPLYGFPFSNWFIDEWFTSVYQEFQMMLVVSWGDMTARLVFALGLLQCMNAVKKILTPVSSKQLGSGEGTAIVPTATQAARNLKALPPVESTIDTQEGRFLHRSKQYLLHTLAPRCFIVWGFVILAIQLYAESRATNWPCKLHLRPWLTSKPACSLVEIDCHQLAVAGSESSLDLAWTRFEPTLTAHVTIRHCPELTVPPAIHQFRGLTSLKVYNSSIPSWPTTAAITAKAHENLRALYFIRTAFANATLPEGLTSREFPQTFRTFVASATNLRSLPADLHLAWPPKMSFALENSLFTAVPDVLMRLLPEMVSMADSPLRSVPAGLFEIPTLQTLVLCDTEIEDLPRDVRSTGPDLYLVLLSGTNVSTIWSWMDPVINFGLAFNLQLFNLYGTPLCTELRQIEAGSRVSFSAAATLPMSALATAMDVSTSERLAYSKKAIGCDLQFGSFFPLELEDSVSGLNFL